MIGVSSNGSTGCSALLNHGAPAGSTAGVETAMHGTIHVGSSRRPRQSADREHLRRWSAGAGLLTFHVSVFLSGVVVLFLVNLATSPADLWVERVAWLWLVLLVIHALTVLLVQLVALLRGEDTGVSWFGASRSSTHAPARDCWATPPTALTARATAPGGNGTAPFVNWPEPADDAPEPEPALPVAGTWSEWLPASTETDGGVSAWSNGDYVPTHVPLPSAPLSDRASWEEAGVGAWLSRRGHLGGDAEHRASSNGRAAANGQTDHT